MKFIDLNRQYKEYKENILEQIHDVLDSSSFIMGGKIKEFEEKMQEFTGAKYAVGVSSGTDALLLALMALNIGPGDEIVTTPFTFIATAEVISFLGAKPVFCDIDPKTYNISPEKVNEVLSDRTKAVIAVSLFGQCADIPAIKRICRKRAIPVIEDAAQSLGAISPEGKSCSIANISTTSFFPAKPLGCFGDGGMIFTDNESYAGAFRELRVHGQQKRYYHTRIGINARLDTIQAAVLLAKLPFFKEELSKREDAGNYYTENFFDIDGITTPKVLPGYSHVYAQYSIQVYNRDYLVDFLKEKGIPIAVHYPVPLHLQPVFSFLELPEGSFPVAEKVASRILSIPIHPFISQEEQDIVIENIKKGIKSEKKN